MEFFCHRVWDLTFIIVDVSLVKLSALFSPKICANGSLVTDDLSLNLLNKIDAGGEDIVLRIVLVGEPWTCQFDSESKVQSNQWLARGSLGFIKFKAESFE